MTNSYVQNIINADIDAIALSQFTQVDANTMIPRRLAPAINSLDHYLQYLDGMKRVFTQQSGYVSVNGSQIKVLPQVVAEAGAMTGAATEAAANAVNAAQTTINNADGLLVKLDRDAKATVNSAIEGVAIDANLVTDALIKTVPKAVGAINRTQASINAEKVSVIDFGASTSIDDNQPAIQAAIDYCHKNKLTCHIPAGEYKIKKPLIIKGYTSSTSGSGRFKFVGEGRENVTFLKTTNEVRTDLPVTLQQDAVIILADENLTGAIDSQCRQVALSGFSCKAVTEGAIEYGVCLPTSVVESSFEDIMTQNCRKAFYSFGGHVYLCSFNRFRLTRCDYGFYITNAVNTSLRIYDLYVVTAYIIAIKVSAHYSIIVNPAVDSCRGVCYDLNNFRGTVVTPGCESKDADIVFNFSGRTPHKTNVVIEGAQANASTKSTSTHINMGIGKVVFIGGRVNYIDGSTATTLGKLVEFNSTNAIRSTLKMIGVETNNFSVMPENPQLNLSFIWEDWDSNSDDVKAKLQTLISSYNKTVVRGDLRYTRQGDTALYDAFGNLNTGGFGASKTFGAAADIPDNDYNKATRTGFYFGAGDGALNAPPAPLQYGGLFVIKRTATQVMQMVFGGTSVRVRTTADGVTWTAWVKPFE